MMLIFSQTRPATLADISWLRRAMGRALGDMRLNPEIVEDFELVVSEIGANVVDHASPPAKTIGVTVHLDGHGLALEIDDDGGAFAGFSEVADRSVIADANAESGRGLWLAGQALDRISYRTIANRNRFSGWRGLLRQRPTILIVEDTPSLLEMYCDYLKSDCRVVACGSLEQARQMLRACHVDVVLADLHLGDGLGSALPLEFDEAGNDASAPVILISSDQSSETRDKSLRLGAEFFVSKPVRAQQLRETVSLALARAGLRDARLARSFARHVDGLITTWLPPTIGGYAAGVVAGAATAGGGDLVLHFDAGDAQRIVVIDVMGHGVPARAWAVAYAAIVRTLQHCRATSSAADFLSELARLAWEEPSLQHAMATMIVVDLDADGATFASAGHPGPIVCGDTLHRPDAGGQLLGVLPPAPYEATHISLVEGARMYLITDGLDPADVAAGGAPPQWFADALETSAALPFAAAQAALADAAQRALGPQPADDWTIVSLERLAGESQSPPARR